MTDDASTHRVFISAAEQSADEHAAGLIRAVRRQQPHVTFAGLAGPAMRDAGCETFHDMTRKSAMALAAVRRVPEALHLLHRLKRYLADGQFHAAVLVDSPTLHLPIARLCRQRRIPVLYYIAPQTWAWAPWRNARIRRRVDRLACIWPFEADYFGRNGIPATYVGHPCFDRLVPLDQIKELRSDLDDRVARLRSRGSPIITLLPGSRRHVVREVLPGQLQAAALLKKRFRQARFLVVPANEECQTLIEAALGGSPCREFTEIQTTAGRAGAGAGDPDSSPLGAPDLHAHHAGSTAAESAPIDTRVVARAAAIRAADLVLVASGTITLEVAYHGTPMIVMYNANRWMYHLFARWLITTPHLSIPNILAGRRIVPEFMPYYRSIDPIVAAATEWLSTPASLARVRRELAEVIRPIVRTNVADNVAAELLALLAQRAAT